MYVVDGDKFLQRIVTRQLHCTALALLWVFSSLSHEAVEPLHTEQPAVKRPRVIALDDEKDTVRSLAETADVGFSQEN